MDLNKITELGSLERQARPFRLGAQDAGSSTNSGIVWYWNRLRCMSPLEVAYRLRQRLGVKAQQFGILTAHKVPIPNTSRPAYAFVGLGARPDAERLTAQAEAVLAGRVTVFDREYTFADLPEWNRDPKTGRVAPLVFGKNIDYRDEYTVGDIKYLWEINRHLDLVALAQAYRLTGGKKYLDALRRLLESWFDQCPYLLGVNWTSSLELGIRLVNWSLIWQLIGGLDATLFLGARGAAFRDRWLTVIYQHMHFIQGNLSRFSSANNHLIGEAAGLYVAATTWPFWDTTFRWRAKARRELVREAIRQNAPDGVNREQAISYQQFVLDFLLLAGLAGRANADDFPVEYWQRIERMLEFIAAVMDVRGNVPMIGDADDGYVVRLAAGPTSSVYRSLLATGAAIFRRGDFKVKAGAFDDKSRWILGQKGEEAFADVAERLPAATVRRAFSDGGYYLLGADFETPREVRIVADAGPLGYQSIAAHGHADALAFTLSLAGHEFLIDPGTYAYHTERWWRDYFRGTAAHNALRIDGENQSVIGGSFMWTHHANVQVKTWETGPHSDRLIAWHGGYSRLVDPVRHERELLFDKGKGCLNVSDVVECAGTHYVECFWHFAEDVHVVVGDGFALAEKGGHKLRLIPEYPLPVKVSVYRGDATIPAGWISRRFGAKSPTTTLVWRVEIARSVRLNARLECVFGTPRGAI